MPDYQIIIASNYSSSQGLASYIYKAFMDIVGSNNVTFVGEEARTYSTDILTRAKRKFDIISGKSSFLKRNKIIENLQHDKLNIVIFFNTSSLHAKDIKYICSLSQVFSIHYCSDHPYGMFSPNKEITLETVPNFDLIITMAEQLKPVFYQLGAKWVERIPFAYCKYTHLEANNKTQVSNNENVAYFGTWTKDIEKWIEPLLEFDLEIEGTHWSMARNPELRKIALNGPLKADANMAIAAKNAAVVVNFTRAPHGCFHTMKTFELAIAGAAIVSNYSEEQEEFFPKDTSYKYFNTKSEMLDQVRYLIKNKDEAMLIRENCKKLAMPHNYHNRMTQLLDLLKNTKIIN